jgi:thioredoxin-related protein
MNEHYYAVKFNTEKEGPITVNDTIYKVNPKYGRNGTHELAVELLQGKMSYPTFVFLDERFKILGPLPGFQTPEQIEPVMRFFAEGQYLNNSWDVYSKNFSPTWK